MKGALEDHEEIRQLIARYCHLIDSLKAEEWAALFTDDGALVVADNKTQGREALQGFAQSLRGVYETNPMRHVITNVMIDIDGDEASSQSYIQVLNPGSPTTVGMTGRYEDRLRRIDGQWRFVERRMDPDISLG